MRRRTICEKCNSVIEYEDKSIWLGNRERENINCPICDNIVGSVFTDLIPNVRVLKEGIAQD